MLLYYNLDSYLYRISILNCGDSMTEERKHAILFSATILAARKLAEIGDKHTESLYRGEDRN